MAKVDGRIHLALACCLTALETEPVIPPDARNLIICAMKILLGANKLIDEKDRVT